MKPNISSGLHWLHNLSTFILLNLATCKLISIADIYIISGNYVVCYQDDACMATYHKLPMYMCVRET